MTSPSQEVATGLLPVTVNAEVAGSHPIPLMVIHVKSAALSGFLEAVFPGLGLIYATNYARGVVACIVTIVASAVAPLVEILLVAGAISDAAAKTLIANAQHMLDGHITVVYPDYTAATLFGIVSGILLLAWLVVRIDWAVASARHHNRRFPGTVIAMLDTPLVETALLGRLLKSRVRRH